MSRRETRSAPRPLGRLTGMGVTIASVLVCCFVLTNGAPAQLPPTRAQLDELQGMQLADAERCNACHAMDKKLIGPPFLAIAARHANENRKLLVDVLAQKIILGGAGDWGVVPMVPNEHVSMHNARRLAAWILSLNDGRR